MALAKTCARLVVDKNTAIIAGLMGVKAREKRAKKETLSL